MDDTRKMYEGTEPYIFVSYARKDAETVLPLIDALQAEGYRMWYDGEILPLEVWSNTIATRIARCSVCVAFHSAVSAKSRHCEAELHWARKKQRKILSVYLEDGVELPPGLEMYLDLEQAVKPGEFASLEAFAARVGQVAAASLCRAPVWNKIGKIQWKLDGDGVLTIERNEDLPENYFTGSISAYQHDPVNHCSTAPWMAQRKKIRSVVIADDIDEIGENAFCNCADLNSVTIPNSVIRIDNGAFWNCPNLRRAEVSAWTYLDPGAFDPRTEIEFRR